MGERGRDGERLHSGVDTGLTQGQTPSHSQDMEGWRSVRQEENGGRAYHGGELSRVAGLGSEAFMRGDASMFNLSLCIVGCRPPRWRHVRRRRSLLDERRSGRTMGASIALRLQAACKKTKDPCNFVSIGPGSVACGVLRPAWKAQPTCSSGSLYDVGTTS